MQESAEELADMDRKSNSRTSSVPPKGNGGDSSNRKSDHGKQTRKRENGNNRPKQDTGFQRKQPVPQKSKAFSDKRPQSRGNRYNRNRDEVAKEDRAEPELGSALRPFGKKTNLNHLLNFTFAPREQERSGRPRSNVGRRRIRYNKEQFLQANCQFIVSSDEDYTLNAVDPDCLVSWEHVKQVRIISFDEPTCPICLYPPVAAKITRCGHIYCWTCMLHYLSLADKAWNKCPICYDAVEKEHLKSVSVISVHQYSPGQEITMRLMKRERGSTLVMPQSQWKPRDGKPFSVDDDVEKQYSKLILASDVFVKALMREERLALEEKLREESDTIEASFIQGALDILKNNQDIEAEVHAMAAELQVTDLVKAEELEEEVVTVKEIVSENYVEYASAFDDLEEENGEPTSTTASVSDLPSESTDNIDVPSQDSNSVERGSDITETCSAEGTGDVEQPSVGNEQRTEAGGDIAEREDEDEQLTVEEAVEELALPPTPKQSAQKAFYFYQSADGQNIFMNALSAHMLIQEYGRLENCPETITATIVDMERIFMTEELRKRLRYLSYMPLTCEFSVAELKLRPPIVSKETVKRFAGQIEHRRRMRQKKAREEHKRSKEIQEEENKKMGLYPALRVPIESRSQFPEYNNTNEILSSSPGHRSSSPLTTTSNSSADTPFGSPMSALNPFAAEFRPGSPVDDNSQSSTPSFAQMLKAGKAKPTPVAAWPMQAFSTPSKPQGSRLTPGSEDNSDNEDRVPVPVFQTSFGDAIQAALDKMDSPDTHKAAQQNGVAKEVQTSGKKKKVPTATLR